jgi:D-3-phosphoglycerate dehydrogenase
MKILLLDHNHPLITEQLLEKGFILEEDFTSSYDEVLKKLIIMMELSLEVEFL